MAYWFIIEEIPGRQIQVSFVECEVKPAAQRNQRVEEVVIPTQFNQMAIGGLPLFSRLCDKHSGLRPMSETLQAVLSALYALSTRHQEERAREQTLK